MKKEAQAISDDIGQLANDVRALMAATADLTGEKVANLRRRLSLALDRGQSTYERVREKAMEGAKATQVAVRAHPYQVIAISVGIVGTVLLAYFLARQCSRNGDFRAQSRWE